jgi:hypothetical protein
MFEDRKFNEAWEAADPLEINEEDGLDEGGETIGVDVEIDLDRKSRF